MKTILVLVFLIISNISTGKQIIENEVELPKSAHFVYEVFTNSDNEKIGTYEFSIKKSGESWLIDSTSDIYVKMFFMEVIVKEDTFFVFNGRDIVSYKIDSYKKIPFSGEKKVKLEGKVLNEVLKITGEANNKSVKKEIKRKSYDHFKNLISRIIGPFNLLQPKESVEMIELDPADLTTSTTIGKGLRIEDVTFNNKKEKVYVIEYSNKASDQSAEVYKFENGLTYRVNGERAYTKLKEMKINN